MRGHFIPRFRGNLAPALTLEAIKGEQTLIELSDRFQVHPNQITQWKKKLLAEAEEVFASGKRQETEETDVKELHAKIGQLAVENDFLAGALGRISGRSAKR